MILIPLLIGFMIALFCFKPATRKYLLTILVCAIVFNFQYIVMFLYMFHCMLFGHDCL